MKTLKNYIKESLSLDMKLNETSLLDIEGAIKANDEAIKQTIEKWINDNFKVQGLKISDNPNSDGKYEVSAKNVSVKNKNITSLANELFVWKEVKLYFDCFSCPSLKSLEGAPEKVDGYFNCYDCSSLTSLKGAPKKIGRNFDCSNCPSLTSLEGAPEKVGRNFDCSNCPSLTSLEGAPKEVGDSFDCSDCKSLKSTDLPATTKIKGEIFK